MLKDETHDCGELIMETPWGTADSVRETVEGVYEVTTPSHGGIMLRHWQGLSAPAQLIGERFGPYMAYEEDCAYACVYADMPGLFRQSVALGVITAPPEAGETDESIRTYFLSIAQRWFSEAYGLPCHFCESRGQANCYKHSGSYHEAAQ